MIKMYTSVNFLGFLEQISARKKIKAKKHDFEVRKRIFAPKILKKLIEVNIFTKNNHEFFQNFQSEYASQKNL